MKKVITGILTAVTITAATVPVMAEEGKTTLYIAGDATAQMYRETSNYPQKGWGQVFADYFSNDIIVENQAIGGRSAKKFADEGRLDKMLEALKPGDYFFIQFGIEDSRKEYEGRYSTIDEYKQILKERYIAEAEKRGAIPVLMTPCAQLSWDDSKSIFSETRVEYSDATRELASETGCSFIDVNRLMTDAFNSMDKDEVYSCFMICEPLECIQQPAGVNNRSNFKEKGAKLVTKLIVNAIPKCVPELSKYIKYNEGFSDIYGHWAEKEIKLAFEKGFVNGNDEGKFLPDSDVTRAEFLKMAMNAAGIPGHYFRDGECLEAGKDDWYNCYLQSALDKGLIPAAMTDSSAGSFSKTITSTTDSQKTLTVDIIRYLSGFNANIPITREEMAVLAMNCLSYTAKQSGIEIESTDDVTGISYSDVSTVYLPTVQEAFSCGLVNGVEGNAFNPKDNLTRAQAVTVIDRISDKLRKTV